MLSWSKAEQQQWWSWCAEVLSSVGVLLTIHMGGGVGGGLMPTLQPSSRFNIITPLIVSVMNRLLCHCFN